MKKTPRGASTQRLSSPNDYQIAKPVKKKGNKSKSKKTKVHIESEMKLPPKRLVSETSKKKKDTERLKSNSKKDLLKKEKQVEPHRLSAYNYYGSAVFT